MKTPPMQLALRELRADFTSPKGLVALVCLGVLLGISGPFETLELLPFVWRVGYWLVVTFSTYAVGALINTYLHYRYASALNPLPVQVLVCGTATAIGVFATLLIINSIAFGWIYGSAMHLAIFAGMVWAICLLIVLLLLLFSPYPTADVPSSSPALLSRLAFENRGALVALTVEDHYVQVTTSKGREMILMRFSDAMKETAPVNGLQVHRSHWVAREHVVTAKRAGDRATLTLTNGAEVPVSRSYLPAVRDAGLFG